MYIVYIDIYFLSKNKKAYIGHTKYSKTMLLWMEL